MSPRWFDSPWPYFVGAGLLLLAGIASQFEIRTPSRPEGTPADIQTLAERDDLSVVFVLIDTLRADRLGAYGYERNTTPNLDALVSQGILFKNVEAQSSWTKASMASIWTGSLPANTGVVRYNDVLPEEAKMPAEIFHEAGYRTAGIWRNGWVAPNFGFGQGFDQYINPKAGRERLRIQSKHPSGRVLQGTDEDIMLSAFEFLDAFGKDRFFLYMHFMDLHQYVYDDASPEWGTSYSDSYDKSLAWTDRVIGEIVNRIEEIGEFDSTVIVVMADHGEAFREHGIEGHARNLHTEVTKVPALIVLPFRLQQPIVVEEEVSNIDIWPTVLDMLGLPELPNADGKSLMPLVMASAGIGSGDERLERVRYSHLDRRWGSPKLSDPMVAVQDGDKRILWRANNPERSTLYDVRNDPGEQQDLYSEDDPEAERLAGMAKEYLEVAESPWGVETPTIELDELRLNQLRALGYVIKP